MEIWKEIKGFEGVYAISSKGRVKSLARQKVKSNSNPHTTKERILKQQTDRYQKVYLRKNGVLSTYYIHRFLAEAFVDNPENKPQVNHINGNKLDNRIENLEWTTPKENTRHAFKNGLIKRQGESNSQAKLTEWDVRLIRFFDGVLTDEEAGRDWGITPKHIRKIRDKKAWQRV